MTSSRPYLLRAIYDWILDNSLTPYILVDALMPGVIVPEQFIEDGKIVLNLNPMSIGNLLLGNTTVEFDARFSGVAKHICIPIHAVEAIYSVENGRGMVFSEDGEDLPPSDEDDSNDQESGESSSGGSHLKIVK